MNFKDFIKTRFVGCRKKVKSPGQIGEKLACKFLKSQKYIIEEKNFRSRFGEIDIIAIDSNTICFVEVKSRSRIDYGLPEEYVDIKKQKKIIRTAQTYLKEKGLETWNARFDIVSVDLKKYQCRIVKNAFEVN